MIVLLLSMSVDVASPDQFGLERVDTLVPDPAVALQPGVHLAKGLGPDRVEASGAFRANVHEAGLPQDAKVPCL